MMNMDKLKDREDRVEHIMRLLRGLPETCRDAAVWLLEDCERAGRCPGCGSTLQ